MSRHASRGQLPSGLRAALARVRRRFATWYRVVRPVVLAAVAAAGAWSAAYLLSDYPWHHFMAAWVVSVGVAAYASVGLFKEGRNRLRLHRWLRTSDVAEAAATADEARRAARDLTPRHRKRFQERQRAIEQERRAR